MLLIKIFRQRRIIKLENESAFTGQKNFYFNSEPVKFLFRKLIKEMTKLNDFPCDKNPGGF
jgi:hypothetical protein